MKLTKVQNEKFEKKFQARMESIARQISPAAYAHADATGTLDKEGPQIYGELKEYLASELALQKKEIIKEFKDILKHHEEHGVAKLKCQVCAVASWYVKKWTKQLK